MSTAEKLPVLADPTRQYSPTQLQAMVGAGAIRRASQPEAPTVTMDIGATPWDDDDSEVLESPTTRSPRAAVVQAIASARRASTTAAPDGTDLAQAAHELRAAARRKNPDAERAANAALNILNRPLPGIGPANATIDLTGNATRAPAGKPALPGMPDEHPTRELGPARVAKGSATRASEPAPTPSEPDRFHARLFELPPPDLAKPSTGTSGPRHARLETIETDDSSKKKSPKRSMEREGRQRATFSGVVRALTATGIGLGLCAALRLFMPSTWWAPLMAIALIPVLTLSASCFATRLLSWMWMPRAIVIVIAAVSASAALLAAVFCVSWAVGTSAHPWPPLDDLHGLATLLNQRLAELTALTGPQLMGWWAGLLLAVTMAASLGAARLGRR